MHVMASTESRCPTEVVIWLMMAKPRSAKRSVWMVEATAVYLMRMVVRMGYHAEVA